MKMGGSYGVNFLLKLDRLQCLEFFIKTMIIYLGALKKNVGVPMLCGHEFVILGGV